MKTLATAVVMGLALLATAQLSIAQDAAESGSRDSLEQEASRSLSDALAELVAVLADSTPTSNRLGAVKQIVRQRLDYQQFARFALDRSRDQFSAEQLARYDCEFNRYLSDYIGSRLVRYHQEQIEVYRATALPSRDVILSTRISGGEYDQAVVTFLMRKSANYAAGTETTRWRAIDIAFEGTKVRKLLRSQFQSILEQGGPEQLIATLQEKTPGRSRCGFQPESEPSELDPIPPVSGDEATTP